MTGSARGLGKGMAIGLAEAGCSLMLVDAMPTVQTEKEIETIGASARSVICDLRETTSIARIVSGTLDAYGRIDILVNNAGITRRHPAIEFPIEDWDDVMNVNLRACFLLSQAVARQMIEHAVRGRIINIASMQSFQTGERISAYTAAKTGILGLTRALAREWARYGINVNAIAPGYFTTEMTESIMKDTAKNETVLGRIPAGRWGTPDDLKGAVVFLASEASAYVHGAVVCVDGGWQVT